MNSKSQVRNDNVSVSPNKRFKTLDRKNSYLRKTLSESCLLVNNPPEKCVASQETIHIIRNIKKNLQKHYDYPRNVSEFITNLKTECEDWDVLKHYLFPNIVRITGDSPEEHPISDSVIKILLSVPIIQDKLIDFIFEKAIDLAVESKCGPWIQMILKCISSLDSVVNTEMLSTNLINLLDTTTETIVRLEIITAIPDIIGDQEHSNIASEMSRILSQDHDLIPAILDCLSYLCLSDEQYEQLQKKTLNILMTLSKYNFFPNFVKFLLLPGRISDNAYFEAVHGLRNALGWPSAAAEQQDIATSQVLTATAIRNSMISSKGISNSWLKVVSSCKTSVDHKPIDFIILLILYSTSEEKQKQVETLIRKQIKFNILKEDALKEVFEKYRPILKHYLKHLTDLTNSLLKTKTDPMVESFASQTYTIMFSELEDCRQNIVAEILHLGLDRKQCVMNILLILNGLAEKNISLLRQQSVQMLTLLDRMDNMSLNEIRAVMNLLCGLAYTYENSVIRDDMHMIIRKELCSSNPIIKTQGIFAGVHAVKYLMQSAADEDNTVDLPDDISYGSVNHLAEGDLREAAQIIELISRSTRQFPDLIAFFYDELSDVILSVSHINKHFLSWLTDAVTNDLQQNFIVDSIGNDKIGDLKLSMQFCLNADSEMDEVIAINIAGLTLQFKSDIHIGILSPLFQLVQILHSKQHDGDLSSIDALLGCPVIIPTLDVDLIEDMDSTMVSNILDCLIHCTNWFRELLNAFADQDDDALKTKIVRRVLQVKELENLISKILIKSKISYKPPTCVFNISKYTNEHNEKKTIKTQSLKQNAIRKVQDDTVLPETMKSQITQIKTNTLKDRIEAIHNMPYRRLNFKVIHLIKNELTSNNEQDNSLSVTTLNFLLGCVNHNLKGILISKIKRKTFLTKQDNCDNYDSGKAGKTANLICEILPKTMIHLEFLTSYLENIAKNTQEENGFIHTAEIDEYLSCLEKIYNLFTIFFKWMELRNRIALLKSALRIVASIDSGNLASLNDLILSVAKYLQKQAKLCLNLSTAVALIEFLKSIEEYSQDSTVTKVLRDMAHSFLSKQWKSSDGLPEKGLHFNQSVDKFAACLFINNEILTLKNITLQLTSEIELLKNRHDTLSSFKCINKNNFPVLYRNLGSALYEAAKTKINKGLTNSEHLVLWKEVATVLKYMSEISKTLESRTNLSTFFKKSLPVLKLFSSQGIPILELQFKTNTEEILEILKILQQSTRFLQSLCCHSRLKKDAVLMNKVPLMRQLLETLIYKVKAVLAANNCSEAFWMGNLKNKNIHGEVISTQQSIEIEESVEDCDEQLPDDDETDDEMLDPESKSLSDIV